MCASNLEIKNARGHTAMMCVTNDKKKEFQEVLDEVENLRKLKKENFPPKVNLEGI